MKEATLIKNYLPSLPPSSSPSPPSSTTSVDPPTTTQQIYRWPFLRNKFLPGVFNISLLTPHRLLKGKGIFFYLKPYVASQKKLTYLDRERVTLWCSSMLLFTAYRRERQKIERRKNLSKHPAQQVKICVKVTQYWLHITPEKTKYIYIVWGLYGLLSSKKITYIEFLQKRKS